MALLPPFNLETATKKVKVAQDLWNTRDAARVAQAYTPDSVWRNRDRFFSGTQAIEAFLRDKWTVEHNYRLRKELFCFADDRIAVEFWYEYSSVPDPSEAGCKWFRTYGIEHWVFEREGGKMKSRQMSGNAAEIKEEERWFKDDASVEDVAIPRGHISST